jgi:hypothetical protein
MKKKYTTIKLLVYTTILLLFITTNTSAQNFNLAAAKEYVKINQSKHSLSNLDINAMTVSSEYLSPSTGWYHVYFNQNYQNIQVLNGILNITLKDGHLIHMANSFFPNIEQLATNVNLIKLKPLDALLNATKSLKITPSTTNDIKKISSTQNFDGKTVKEIFQDKKLSHENIEVKMFWYTYVDNNAPKPLSKIDLVYNVKFVTLDHKDAWNVMVNVNTGEIIGTKNEVIKCDFGTNVEHSHLEKTTHDVNVAVAKNQVADNSYTVFDYPLESPIHGSRTSVTSPYSRFVDMGTGPGATNGWHEDGINFFTDTRGNNVYAQEDVNSDNSGGIRPSSPNLEFNYPYTQGLGTSGANQNASITNLFYWNNFIHDVLWKMGFDEPSGNFQYSNLNRGGLGNDFVYADAQDGSGSNNANFYTPVDGSNPRMQMFLWNYPSTYLADSDFDNAIIAHEYGHGWSIRLTGGPNTTSCLWNAEQGGEGWSDYLGLMLTTDWANLTPTLSSANIPRGIGTYVLGQSTNGLGIRPFPYSYDMANINPTVTYGGVGNSSTFSQPHGIGSIWATMLWDMTWSIIMQDQIIVPNIYNTTDFRGNVAALKLVNEGLKLQPCSPSFVDARNAILAADAALFNGRYACAIGNAFARRGLGAHASTGSSSNDRVVIQDFTPFSDNFLVSPLNVNTCSGDSLRYTAISSKQNSTYSWQRDAVPGISNPAATGNTQAISEVLVNTTNTKIIVQYRFTLSPDSCGPNIPNFVNVTVNPGKITPLVSEIEACMNDTYNPNLSFSMPSPTNGTPSITSSLSTQDPIFTKPVYTGRSYYKTYSFVSPISGSVRFNLNSGAFDAFLALYSSPFNPLSENTNLLAYNDDYNGLNSQITHNLISGQTYILVVATYYSLETGSFTILTNTGGFADNYNWYLTETSTNSIFVGQNFNPVGIGGSNIPNLQNPITQDYYVSASSNSVCRSKTNYTVNYPNIENLTDGTVSNSIMTCAIFNTDTLNVIGNSSNILGWTKSNNNFQTQTFINNKTTQLITSGLVQDSYYRAIVYKPGNCIAAYTIPAKISIVHPFQDISTQNISENDSVRAGFGIVSKSIIDSTSRIKYQAEKFIILDTNFTVANGAVFETQLIENECYIPASVTIIPDSTNSNDTEISSLLPNNNFSSNRYFVPFAWNQFGSTDVRRSLIKFDLSSIPEDAIIDSAFLSLYYSQYMINQNPPFTGHFGDNSLEIIKIDTDWLANTVTWSNQPALNPTLKITVNRSANQTQDYLKINVRNIIQSQIGSTAGVLNNNGVLIKNIVETPYKLTSLTSSEEINTSKRPKLIVYYRYK